MWDLWCKFMFFNMYVAKLGINTSAYTHTTQCQSNLIIGQKSVDRFLLSLMTNIDCRSCRCLWRLIDHIISHFSKGRQERHQKIAILRLETLYYGDNISPQCIEMLLSVKRRYTYDKTPISPRVLSRIRPIKPRWESDETPIYPLQSRTKC